MSNEKLYAIIDGASEEELMPMLAELDPPAACLYAPPVQPDLVDIAPYVVLVTEEVQEWLNTRETPWGIYITTDADLKSVRSHLRKYLYVLLPDSDKPVFFRFYDPRNIWLLTSALTDWELHSFMGPIEKIGISFEGNERAETFAERRAQYPQDAQSTVSTLALTEEQVEIMNQEFERNFIIKLARLMEDAASSAAAVPHVNFLEYAHRLFDYFKSQDITLPKTVRETSLCLIEKEYYDFDEIPRSFFDLAEDDGTVGWGRAGKACQSLIGL